MEIENTKKSKTTVQWLVGLVANSLSFVLGLQSGWMSPMAKTLQSSSSPTGTPLTDYDLGWIASILPITALVFVPIFASLADRFGRKTCLLLMAVPQLASWLFKMISPSTITLMIARACCGAAAAGCFTVIPMYNKEISQDSNRAHMGVLVIVGYNLGLLVMYALGAFLEYYVVLYSVVWVPAAAFVLLLMCPESPGYLVKVGKIEKATQKLAMLRSLHADDKTIQKEIRVMKEQDEYYKSLPSLSIIAILKDKAWRRACVLGIILISVQAFSGNYALITYGASILAASGMTINPELQTLSFPMVMMTGSIISLCVVEKFGRRGLLLTTYLVSAASLASLAAILQLPQGTTPGWLMLVLTAASMIAYTGGVLSMPYVVMAELFNIQIRAKMMGIVISIAWIVSFTQLASFAPIKSNLGIHINFYLYAAVHLLGVAAILVLLPETKGKSIEQVEIELRNK